MVKGKNMSRRHDSENEDDPEPFQSSGDEWDLEQARKEEVSRRKSSRISRKTKRPVIDESGSDEDDAEISDEENSSEEEPSNKRKSKGRKGSKAPSPKKQKISNDSDLSNDTNSNLSQEDSKKEAASTDSDSSRNNTTAHSQSRGIHRKFIPKTIYSEDYATGSFVILKKDAQVGDPSKHPVIWRIDGKALLQKYEAFDEDNKVRHKNTSIYTGWSPLDKDLYAPITVDVIRHNNNNLTVEVQWDKLKIINADSD